MKLPSLTEIAKGAARFKFYRDGALYYDLYWMDGGVRSVLRDIPIPVDDTGAGEFGPDMKGMYILRWVRKHVELITKSQEQQDAAEEEEISVDPYATYKEGLENRCESCGDVIPEWAKCDRSGCA